MTALPVGCELWVDGTRYADGQPTEISEDPFALTGLRITWGRTTTVDQPEPSTCSFSIADPPGGSVRFDDTVRLGSTVVVYATLDGIRYVVFAGRVTDLDAAYDTDAAVCEVVAADQLADLANRFVGSEPWPAEQMWQRAHRIVTAVGLDPNKVLATIPAPQNSLVVSRMDVDRQSATVLLQELATSTGFVLWSSFNAAKQSQYLIFEDPAARASLYVFGQALPSLLWTVMTGTGAGTPMTSCNVLQDPVHWRREVGDLITRVAVRWADQTTAPGTTERTVSLIDSASESTYGARGLSVGTILTTSNDATALAGRLLAAHQPSDSWRTEGLTWDLSLTDHDDSATRSLAVTLLDNVARLGYAIALTDLPYWTPTAAATQLYIEGGDYAFEDGHWVLALQGAPATGLGGSLTYGATDRSVRYADIDCSVSFLEMTGVGPAGPTGPRWQDIPAATTWASVPADIDWSEDPR
jgi:hypothetical protein